MDMVHEMLGLRRRNLIGLDIDTSAVRMVRLRRDGAGYAVAGANVADIAPWGDNPQLRRFHTVQAMRECLAAPGMDGGPAVCGLRGTEVVVRGFEFPALPPEEIEGAVGLEASQICPFGTEESTLDFQVTSNDNRNTRGFWVAANNTLIRDTRQLVHEAGLHCALVDVAGLALLNVLAATGLQARGTGDACVAPTGLQPILLDIGSSCTTVAAADQAGQPFVRDIGFGGDEILKRVSVEARMPLEIMKARLLGEVSSFKWEVASSRFEVGSGKSGLQTSSSKLQTSEDEDDAIQACLERACAGLLEDIGTTLRYYAAQNNSTRIKEVLVCGGFATTRGLIELLSMKLYVEALRWDPLAQMPCEAGQECESLLRRYGPCLAVAAGLAMRSI